MPNLVAGVATAFTLNLNGATLKGGFPQWHVYNSGGSTPYSPAIGQSGATTGTNNNWTFAGSYGLSPTAASISVTVTATVAEIGKNVRLFVQSNAVGGQQYWLDSVTVVAATSPLLIPSRPFKAAEPPGAGSAIRGLQGQSPAQMTTQSDGSELAAGIAALDFIGGGTLFRKVGTQALLLTPAGFPFWHPQVPYAATSVVWALDGNLYKSLTSGNAGNPPITDSGANWVPFSQTFPAFPVWQSGVRYAVTVSYVTGSDGNIYRCLTSHIASSTNNPINDSGVNWEAFKVNGNLTLQCGTTGSGQRFTDAGSGIRIALAFIKNATWDISAVIVIIQTSTTMTVTESSQILLNHTCGAALQLLGNTSTPANCQITFTGGVNGFVVSFGATINSINGFKLVAGSAGNGSGIFSQQNSYANCGANITVQSFSLGYNASSARMTTRGTATQCTRGFYATQTGDIDAASSTATSNTTGYYCDENSYINSTGSTRSSNTADYSPTPLNTQGNKFSVVSG